MRKTKQLISVHHIAYTLVVILFLLTRLLTAVPIAEAQTTTTKYFNGKIAFNSDRDGNYEIYSINSDTSNITRLTNNPASDENPSWSPDGSKIAFTTYRDGNAEIYTMNADGSNQINITNNPDHDSYPAWSPDGSKLAFVSQRDGNAEIYTMNADGSNQTRITNNSSNDGFPAWSPDGSKLAFNASRDGNIEAYTMNPDGSNQTRITNNPDEDYQPSWSPSGTKLVFLSNRDSLPGSINYEIYTMNADGSNQTRITNTLAIEDSVNYSPDGTKLLATVYPNENYATSELYSINLDGTGRTPLTNAGGYNVNYSAQAWQPLPYTQTTNNDGSVVSTVDASQDYSTMDYTVTSNETLVLNGSLCDVTVQSGGILKGTGTTCTITVQSGGTVNPGNSPGCITSGNLSLSGVYAAELAGTTVCSGYDQIQVTGTVNVGGTLTPSLLSGFIPVVGNTFILIDNDAADAVAGTFNNLAEGATIIKNGVSYKISYVGGDGNDVTLIVTAVAADAGAAAPGVPDTGVKLLAANPIVSMSGAILASLGLVVVARRMKLSQ